MYQQINLIGRLGKDPEMRYTGEGVAVATFDIAVDQPGKKEPIWVHIITWERLAESASKYLNKGSLVHVVGILFPDRSTQQPRVYQRKNGDYASIYEVSARVVTFLSPKSEGGYQEQDLDNIF